MDLFESMNKRASYRGPFDTNPVAREALERIVRAGIDAPSGYNGKSTSFVIVNEPALVRRLASMIGDRPHLSSAPALIVVVRELVEVL